MKKLSPERVSKVIRLAWRSMAFCLVGLFIFILFIRINFLWLFGTLPDGQELENPKTDLPVEIYSEDETLIGRLFREKRIPVKYEEISPNVINALIATEDVRFYEHSGIDGKSVAAIFWYILKGDQRGGSTITQQLAKNLYKTRSQEEGLLSDVPILRLIIYKTKEWITAIRLEANYTKKEILTMYLNTVDFGSNAFGIKVAAKRFFNTTPDKLTYPQAATLVGLLKATTTYSPVLNPEKCLSRRNVVLALLKEQGYIAENHHKYYTAQPLNIQYKQDEEDKFDGFAPYLRAEVLKFVQEWCKQNNRDMYSEGLVIHTTINSKLQKYAEEAVRKHMTSLHKKFLNHWKGKNPWIYENKKEIPGFLNEAAKKTEIYKWLKSKFVSYPDSITYYLHLPKRMKVFSWKGNIDTTFSTIDSLRYYKHFLHTGFLALSPGSGEVKAWVGGIDYNYFQYDHVKQAKRQPGSAFKPFVYATALAQGYSPCDRMYDQPITLNYEENGEKKSWSPKNADWIFTMENMTLRKAMARSINSVAAALMQKVGYDAVVNMARKLGVKSELKAVPALALGASDVSVYELTGAYAAFVNKGLFIEPHFILRIEDNKGNVLYESEPDKNQAVSEEVAYSMLHMLTGGTEIRGGTSQALFVYDIFRGNQIGGKTGTTSNYSDGWFVGVTRDLVAGMWVGGEDRCIHFTTSATGEGSKTALPIFGIFMEKVYSDNTVGISPGYFKKPENYSVDLNCPEIELPIDTTDTESDTLFIPDETKLIPATDFN